MRKKREIVRRKNLTQTPQKAEFTFKYCYILAINFSHNHGKIHILAIDFGHKHKMKIKDKLLHKFMFTTNMCNQLEYLMMLEKNK